MEVGVLRGECVEELSVLVMEMSVLMRLVCYGGECVS